MKHTFLRFLYKIYSLPWRITRPVVLGVRVMLVKGEQVLLVKHTYQDGWLIPGGKVERGETPEQAARRECREEIGAQIGDLEFIGIFTNFTGGRSDHIVLFLSKDFEIVPRNNFEIEMVSFFPLHELPPDMMPGNKKRIEEHLSHEPRPKAGLW